MKRGLFIIGLIFMLAVSGIVCAENCTDSDGGKDYYVKGETSGRTWVDDDTLTSRNDFCVALTGSSTELNQCSGGNCGVYEFECITMNWAPNKPFVGGNIQLCEDGCKDGACIKKETPQKNCADQGGIICEDYLVCQGEILVSNNTNRCCEGFCRLSKSFDWRSRHDENWITSAKNQGDVGSCLYFSTLGTAEAIINLYYNQHLDLDLSEQQLFDCKNDLEYVGLKSDCADCFISDGICSMINLGTVEEQCNPYISISGKICNKNPCENYQSQLWKFQDYYNLAFDYNPPGCAHPEKAEEITEEKIKKTLIEYGPLDLSLFYTEIGMRGHGLVLIGYDTKSNGTYWIFKNSWGSDTEEGDGCFRYPVPIKEVEGIASVQALIKPIPPTPKNYEINCVDKDNDGFCNWGISYDKPLTCPSSCKSEKDWDDSNSEIGALGLYGEEVLDGNEEEIPIVIEPTKETGPIGIPEKNEEPVEIPEDDEGKMIDYVCQGCELDNKCYPFGYRKDGKYCSDDLEFKNQSIEDSFCENNFECKSNVCVSGECVSEGLIKKILNWFRSIF